MSQDGSQYPPNSHFAVWMSQDESKYPRISHYAVWMSQDESQYSPNPWLVLNIYS